LSQTELWRIGEQVNSRRRLTRKASMQSAVNCVEL